MSTYETAGYIFNGKEVCTFCQERRPTGFWQAGEHNLFCCGVCATRILPAFIADSVELRYGPGSMYSRSNKVLREVEAGFWKGIAARLGRA